MSHTTLTQLGHPGVPITGPEKEHRRQMAQAINRINRGVFNCHIDVTLAANTGTTLLTSQTIGYYTAIIPGQPMTADAAADIGTIWIGAPVSATSPTVVINHRINSATDRVIRFALIG